ESAAQITKGRIVNGLLELTQTERMKTTYTVAADAKDNRPLVIEMPRMGADWSNVHPGGAVEIASSQLRIRTAMPRGKFEVIAERPISQRVRLDQLSPDQIAYYAQATEFSPEQREAFRRLGELSRNVNEAESRLAQLETERQSLSQEQER